MITVKVQTPSSDYPIHIADGLLADAVDQLKPLDHGQKWFLFTHPELLGLVGHALYDQLHINGFQITIMEIPIGESSKNLEQVREMYTRLLLHQADRTSTFMALGGGVIGDITGFIAATFLRGVPYIQIPTTLLAMVDSSVGGKTGVNLPEGKNLVGSFYHPEMVLIDPSTLSTLPIRERISGLAEILKYGLIRDRDFFNQLHYRAARLLNLSQPEWLIESIIESCRIKADIVAEDERESGLRRILNFGHTIGHALEAATGYTQFRHGEAVAWGMIAAGMLSEKQTGMSHNDFKALETAVLQLGLPPLTDISSDELIHNLRHDKKWEKDQLNFVLLKEIGEAVVVQDIPIRIISETIHELLSLYSE